MRVDTEIVTIVLQLLLLSLLLLYISIQSFNLSSTFNILFVHLGEKGNSDPLSPNDFLFDEYEIVTEVEPKIPQESYEHENGIYKDYLSKEKKREEKIKLDKELRKMKQKDEDEFFIYFKERIKRDPEQVHVFFIMFNVFM